jgi:hypothetical protein
LTGRLPKQEIIRSHEKRKGCARNYRQDIKNERTHGKIGLATRKRSISIDLSQHARYTLNQKKEQGLSTEKAGDVSGNL